MKKILITGGTGFAGSHLIDFYLENNPDYQLHSIKRRRANVDNIGHLIVGSVKWYDCDITDAHAVEDIIKLIQPDIIHHLAAQSFVPASWSNPIYTFDVNLNGTIHILEAVKKHSPHTILQVASSSETYGIPDIIPITEKNLPEPCSPYAVSKLAMDRICAQYKKSFGIKTVITRAFNHTGPRRGVEFVCSTFAKQISDIEKIGGGTIKVGNLESKRDFTDVRDMVRAYVVSVEECEYGVPYNICSEKMVTIQYVLDFLLSIKKVGVNIVVEKDPERMRPSDLHTLIGDCTQFKNKTGWETTISLERSLGDLLNFWRDK